MEKRLEDGHAALQHLEMLFIGVACDNPGARLSAELVLPALQERIDALAMEFPAKQAEEAARVLIEMEVCFHSSSHVGRGVYPRFCSMSACSLSHTVWTTTFNHHLHHVQSAWSGFQHTSKYVLRQSAVWYAIAWLHNISDRVAQTCDGTR